MRHSLALSLPVAIVKDSWSLIRRGIATLASPPVAVWIVGSLGLVSTAVPFVLWLKCFDRPVIPFVGFLGATGAWLVGVNLSRKAVLQREYGEAVRTWGHESQLMRLYYSHFPRNRDEIALTNAEQEVQVAPLEPTTVLEEATGIGFLGNSGSGKTCIVKLLAAMVGGSGILVLDPHDDADRTNWAGLFVIRDYKAIAQQLELLLGLLDDRDRTPLVVILEEWPAVRMYCKQQGLDIADRFLLRFGSEARKFNKLPIFCSQSGNTKALGMEGMGDFLENFLLIRLHRVALKYARNLSDRSVFQWCKSVAYPCLVGDTPTIHPTHGHHQRFYKGAPPRGLKPLRSLPLTIPLAVADGGEVEVVDGWEPESYDFPERKSASPESHWESLERPQKGEESQESFSTYPHKTALNSPLERQERLERLRQLLAMGHGKGRCIEELWGVKPGGSPRYKMAEGMYEEMIKELE